MADNYLEKRYEEVFGRDSHRRAALPSKPSLDTLLARNRSCRGFDRSYIVHTLQLKAIISVNSRVASAGNCQRLRFRPVTKGPEAGSVLAHIRLGAYLRQMHLPIEGTEPEAFIIVCSTVDESPDIDIDLGISLQSMALKATELGLGCVIVRNFDASDLMEALHLPLAPIAVLCVGKPAEKIVTDSIRNSESIQYYRDADGVHHVPKIIAEDLIIG